MKPVSRTAFYCAGIRLVDAERPDPICGDTYARRFMTEEGLRVFEPFRHEIYPNGSNVTRHRIIDDLLRQQLTRDPGRRISIPSRAAALGAFKLPRLLQWTILRPLVKGYQIHRFESRSSGSD